MTVWGVLGAARRRWAMTLFGLLTTGFLLMVTMLTPGVYASQVDVVFLQPKGPTSENSFQWGTQNLISTAGVVAKIVNWDSPDVAAVSDTAPLTGQGVTHGYSVRLSNIGGQWAYYFDQPILDVQVVGSSPQEVQATIYTVAKRIDETLTAIQEQQGVAPQYRMRTRMSPTEPEISYYRGSRIRAIGGVLLLGLGLTTALVLLVDRRLSRAPALPPVRHQLPSGPPTSGKVSDGGVSPAPLAAADVTSVGTSSGEGAPGPGAVRPVV